MTTYEAEPDDDPWCQGFADGYRVGPDGIDPAGNPIGPEDGYQEALIVHDEYRRGLSAGRSDRINEQIANGTHQVFNGWP